MDDHRHLAPLRDVLHRTELVPGPCDHHHPQRLDHGARRDVALSRNSSITAPVFSAI